MREQDQDQVGPPIIYNISGADTIQAGHRWSMEKISVWDAPDAPNEWFQSIFSVVVVIFKITFLFCVSKEPRAEIIDEKIIDGWFLSVCKHVKMIAGTF